MSLDDWILAMHVLSAFAYVAGVVLFSVLVVAIRRADVPEATIRLQQMVRVGGIAVGIGGVGTIVLGIWLAISKDEYQLWDGWVIAAFVLWAIAGAAGQRTGAAYAPGMTAAQELQTAGQTGPSAELLAHNRTSAGVRFHLVTTVVIFLLLVDMIWKPGA